MPGFVAQQLATLKPRAPFGERWIHEIKYDAIGSRFTLTKSDHPIYPQRPRLDQTLFPTRQIFCHPG
jgi:bifunctional non-homologous end joining protein LigD